MLRTLKDNALTGKEKGEKFRLAYRTINEHIAKENYLASYIIAFSILEDRMMANYITCYRHKNPSPTERLSERKLEETTFSKFITKLSHLQVIDDRFVYELTEINNKRNKLVHLLMWHLEKVNENSVLEVRQAIDKIETAKRHFIKPLKKFKEPKRIEIALITDE